MSKVYVISDLHLGHKSILDFAGNKRGGTTVEEHDEWLVVQWNTVVSKSDLVYVLGDVAFSYEGLSRLDEMKGQKILVRGNHDKFKTHTYLKYFEEIMGF